MRGSTVTSEDGRTPEAPPSSVPSPGEAAGEERGHPRAPDDGQLVARAAGGDGFAFVALFERYKGFVYALCLKILGSVEDAEDCSQEVWVRIQRALDGFQGRSSVRTWIGSIAANRARDTLRERDRFRRVLEAAMQIHRFEVLLVERGEAAVTHGSLVDAVAALDELERRIVELRLQDETLTLDEMGKLLDLPRHKVKYAWSKARDTLRQRLTEWSAAERLLLALLLDAARLLGSLEVFRG